MGGNRFRCIVLAVKQGFSHNVDFTQNDFTQNEHREVKCRCGSCATTYGQHIEVHSHPTSAELRPVGLVTAFVANRRCVRRESPSRVHSERQLAKGDIHESRNVDDNDIDLRALCGRAMHDAGSTKSGGPECGRPKVRAGL
jgi:hypothetical protein